MSKYNTQDINVLNYNENTIFVSGAKEHYKFAPSRNGKTPTVVPIPMNELQYIASNTNVITTGWLTFEEGEKEEIYKELRISNWKDILTIEDIIAILTKPTMEGLQRIIDIENESYFDRVRLAMLKLMDDGVDITTKVSNIVNQRYDELQRRQRKSKIVLTKKNTTVSADTVKELSEQNASLQSQLDEMKKMMEQMMAMQTASHIETNTENKEETVKEEFPKKAGRPPKKTN